MLKEVELLAAFLFLPKDFLDNDADRSEQGLATSIARSCDTVEGSEVTGGVSGFL